MKEHHQLPTRDIRIHLVSKNTTRIYSPRASQVGGSSHNLTLVTTTIRIYAAIFNVSYSCWLCIQLAACMHVYGRLGSWSLLVWMLYIHGILLRLIRDEVSGIDGCIYCIVGNSVARHYLRTYACI